MTYEEILQRAPLSTASGKLDEAAAFVVFLTNTINSRETFGQLSASQQRYLYRLRDKWKVRAAGDDDQWNQYGSRPGRPVVDERKKKPRKSRRADPGEKDPLFISLMKKYGRPIDE